MGIFGSSFKRELGKNSAKVVSNILFGDKFATPYRIIRKQQDQRRNERTEARVYKQTLIEEKRQEREINKQIKELDRSIAELDKKILISDNTEKVKKHNSYISVIQSVHKYYCERIEWDNILKKEPPTEVKPVNEVISYYREHTNNQVDKGISDLKKNAKLSPVSYLLKGMYSKRYKWLFKITGHKKFFTISLTATIITLLYFMSESHRLLNHSTGNSYSITLSLLISFGIVLMFSLLSKYAISDCDKNLLLVDAIKDLENKREILYNENIQEHERAYNQYLSDVKYHQELIETANSIIKGDKNAFVKAIQLLNPFGDIEADGTVLKFSIFSNQLTVDLFVKSDEVVPNTTKRLIRDGLEIKDDPIPTSRFFEIYQDYVCSCILRIAKEVFAMLPINNVLINAKGNLLNTATGRFDEQIIVSVIIEKSKLEKLDFDYLDPSDCMSNFPCNMSFNKANGFFVVSSLIIENPDMPLFLSPFIESDLANIWGNPKYLSLHKYNYYFPSAVENNAILFIGLNPSLSEEDLASNVYTLSQRNNKNQYFKKFEDISEFCNTKWTHLDLLFFRETHQSSIKDILEGSNGVGFIWEQLQISKRIIEASHPKIIVVCNKLSGRFLGKERKGKDNVWIGFNFSPIEYIGAAIEKSFWNNIPVFFTRPLSGMGVIDNSSYDQLKLQIKEALTS